MSYNDVKRSRLKRKQQMIDMMGKECQICGYKKTNSALEFHHINPENKDFNFNMACNLPLEKIINELKKCILVCANCHREIHAGLIEQELFSSFNEAEAEKVLEQNENIKNGKKYFCTNCGIEVSYGNNLCPQCAAILRRKVKNRPNREELKSLIRITSFVQIGNMFNVTDGAIRKWCKSYNLPSTKTEIKTISDEDWEKI